MFEYMRSELANVAIDIKRIFDIIWSICLLLCLTVSTVFLQAYRNFIFTIKVDGNDLNRKIKKKERKNAWIFFIEALWSVAA